jgi:hypothetical protein
MFIRVATVVAVVTFVGLGLARPSLQSGSLPASATAPCPNGGSSGGSFSMSPRVAGAFVISFDSSGVRLDAAMLLRGQRDWARDATGRTGGWPPRVPRQPGDRPPSLSGATVDTFAVVYDRANNVAWIGGQRVPMDGANVVLLDRADGVGGPPFIVDRLRIGPHFSTNDSMCVMADPHRVADIVALLTLDPVIRAFAEP